LNVVTHYDSFGFVQFLCVVIGVGFFEILLDEPEPEEERRREKKEEERRREEKRRRGDGRRQNNILLATWD